jgi:uncharacterized protein (DUF849 family)
MPAIERPLDVQLEEMRRLFPRATSCAAGIGRHQQEVMGWAIARGANAIRTGLEDNIRVTKSRLAASNAELVQIAAATLARANGRPATPSEARAILGLPAAP